jgi:lysophospholipase L1-like esterase
MKAYSYLALGDSYTIGEQVSINDSFPYQTIYQLKKKGFSFLAPEIVAATGFTTDELAAAIDKATLLPSYDIVSLLIGVNNQYRGKSLVDFAHEFEHLLQRAIQFAANAAQHVIVLSIPDWGITPFAADRDTIKIAQEITAFNVVCEQMALQYNTHFIDITTAQKINGNKEDFLAADKLHPSSKEYAKWAALLTKKISSILS